MPAAADATPSPVRPPLHGVRVIDFTHVLAGPACTYQLALLGADVIKVESVAHGDTMRRRGGSSKDLTDALMGTNFLAQNAGKRSLALDVSGAQGRDVFRRLVAGADVLVENHRSAFMPALGLGPDDLMPANPRLVYCRMTGFGTHGPRGNDPAYDVVVQGASGIMSFTGTPETAPLRCGPPILDYASGLTGALAIVAALHQRRDSGRGQLIDLAMLDVALTLMSATVTDHRLTGNEPKPRGNQADSGLPTAGSFPTRDGLLALGINEEHHFRQFAKTVGRAGWLDDPRLRDEAARATDPDLVRRVMIEALAVRSAAEWEPLLAKAGVPAARVNTLKEALAHPHVAARGIVRRLDDIAGVAGPVDVLQSPFQFADGSVGQIARPPARLGAHTREVLAEIGVGDDEITRLMTDGTVGTQRDC